MKIQFGVDTEKVPGKQEETSESWTIDHKKDFLLKAFENIHQTNRVIRERINSNVRYSVTLFIAITAFLLAKPETIKAQLVGLAIAGILLVATLSCFVIWRQFRTLKQQHAIQANIEEAMSFHQEGAYLGVAHTLFPGTASIGALIKSTYYSPMLVAYFAYIFGSATFAVIVLLTSQKIVT